MRRTTKTRAPPSLSKLFTFFAAVFFILFLLRLRFHSTIPSAVVRDAAASIVHRPSHRFSGIPKIAFLFLARRNLPLDFLWQGFFQNADEERFSIYIHSRPGFVFDSLTTRCTFFYGRQIRNSIRVAWGQASMIEAEKLLFREALRDTENERFLLVSDSCVPLYNFSYIYKYIMASSKSFVDSFLDEKEGHYNPRITSTIPDDRWRKGSQWIALVRKHAEVVVADELVFPVFKEYCKPKIIQRQEDCIPDEHYMQTLLAMSELEDELEHRSLTFTSWNQSASKSERQSWHPITFQYDDASPENVKEIKFLLYHAYRTSITCTSQQRIEQKGATTTLL